MGCNEMHAIGASIASASTIRDVMPGFGRVIAARVSLQSAGLLK
jgi:hypothetical protein